MLAILPAKIQREKQMANGEVTHSMSPLTEKFKKIAIKRVNDLGDAIFVLNR